MPTPENCAVLFGEQEIRKERLFAMSENETTRKNSKDTSKPLKGGEEPTELLIALASEYIQALADKELAFVYVDNDENGQPFVLIHLPGMRWQNIANA